MEAIDQNSQVDAPNVPALYNPSPERSLQLFFVYRLALSSTLSGLFFLGWGPALLGRHDPKLYALAAICYLGFVIASGLVLYTMPRLSKANQAFMMVFVDICAITFLMHASGGVESGLGLLLAISVASGSLITHGISAELMAALASLAILSAQVYAHLNHSFETTAYTQTGMLGGSYFALAIMAHVLSARLQRSEALASQRELDLANLENLNAYVIQHMLTGILVVDGDRNIRLMNESAWYLLGMPDRGTDHPLEQASQTLSRLLEDWVIDQARESEPFRPTPGGRELVAGFSDLGRRGGDGVVIFLQDTATITQQAQQMKLASLGRLTASIAHEIRNPLGAISHAEQLLRESRELNRGDRRLVDIINTNAERVNEIIENVLQLSRRDRSKPEEFDLLPWLQQFVEDFLHSHELEREKLTIQVEPEDTLARADPGQLRQILIILCENAWVHFDHDREELRLQINGGITRELGGPFVDVMDNGPGIDPATVRQIFEPFFTTRNAGTGLGLYIAKELSESNRLGLNYIPIPAGGSCFRITFPSSRNIAIHP